MINIDSDDDLDDKSDEDLDTSATNRAYKTHLGTPAIQALLKSLKEVMRHQAYQIMIFLSFLIGGTMTLHPFTLLLQPLLNTTLLIYFAVLVMFHLLGDFLTASIPSTNW